MLVTVGQVPPLAAHTVATARPNGLGNKDSRKPRPLRREWSSRVVLLPDIDGQSQTGSVHSVARRMRLVMTVVRVMKYRVRPWAMRLISTRPRSHSGKRG
jgi:hypothetical protein